MRTFSRHPLWLALALLPLGTAQAATWTVMADGSLRPTGLRAKANCATSGQPTAAELFTFSETLSATTVNENGGTAPQIDLRVLDSCIDGSVQFGYVVAAGSAQPGSDYNGGRRAVDVILRRGTAASSTPVPLNFSVVNDTVAEGDETVLVQRETGSVRDVVNSRFFTLASNPAVATLTIRDDDFSASAVTPPSSPPVATETTVAQSLEQICNGPNPPASLLTQCQALVAPGVTDQQRVAALQAIGGEEIGSQINSAADSAIFFNQGLSSRLAALRGEAPRDSESDMAFRIEGLPGGAGLALDALRAALGADDSGSAGGGLLDQRLGGFVTVSLRRGDRDPTPSVDGFDYDGWSAFSGLDYRFSDRFVAGLALGYGTLDADVGGDGSRLESRSRVGSAYVSLLPSPQWYVEASYSLLRNDYDQRRVVDLRPIGLSMSTALGEADGRQQALYLGAGWIHGRGEWTFSPNVSVYRGRTRIDGFIERGAGDNDLVYDTLRFDSLQLSAGLNLSRAVSVRSGVLAPFLNLTATREAKNDSFAVLPRLRIRPELTIGNVAIDEYDRWFGRAELGVVGTFARGVQVSVSYVEMLGLRNLTARSLQLSARVEF